MADISCVCGPLSPICGLSTPFVLDVLGEALLLASDEALQPHDKEQQMSAYIIVSYDITDTEGYGPYVPGVIPLLQKHNAEILVADYGAKGLEGEARGVNVVLRFSSEEVALAWYNDPDYDAVKKTRLDSTSNGTAVLAKQFVMPSE